MKDTSGPGVKAAAQVGDELPAGTALCQGQYRIVRYLNSGGFGVTYLAHDSLGRKVVIKECFPGAMCCRSQGTVRLRSASHRMDFSRVVELFEREARALAQLEHPNIVGVHQIFKDNGTAYMAMDFVEGPDLLTLLETQRKSFKPSAVRRMLLQLLKALAFVHKNGMLHRDISPDNILLTHGGTPVLIDFGAAREGAVRATRVLSRIHTVKDGYSPQEFYLAGSKQAEPSDLYALAATFHHIIVGRAPPNSNERLAAVAQKQRDPYRPLVGRVPGYDARFLGAIDQCLGLFAGDRLPSAQAWFDIISGKAPMAPAVPSELSDDVKRRISELVTETSSFIEEVEATAPEAEAAAPQAPDPKEEALAAEREYWAILNEDPEEIRAEIEQFNALESKRENKKAGASGRAGSKARVAARWSSLLGSVFGGFLGPRRETGTVEAMEPLRK